MFRHSSNESTMKCKFENFLLFTLIANFRSLQHEAATNYSIGFLRSTTMIFYSGFQFVGQTLLCLPMNLKA